MCWWAGLDMSAVGWEVWSALDVMSSAQSRSQNSGVGRALWCLAIFVS